MISMTYILKRQCYTCLEWKSLYAFIPKRKSYNLKCIPCQNKYLLEKAHQRNPNMKHQKLIDEQELLKLINSGITDLKVLADKLDFSEAGVRKAINRLGVFEPLRKKKNKITPTEQQIQQVKVLFDQGFGQ